MKHDASKIIEDYLLGNLTETEAREVEKRAETDPEFATELQFQKDILQGVNLFGDERMRARISKIDQELDQKGFFKNGNSAPSANRRYLWLTIGFLLLVLSGVLWWYLQEPTKRAPKERTPPTPIAAKPETRPVEPNVSQPKDAILPTQRPAQQPDPRMLALARASWSAPDFSGFRSTQKNDTTVATVAATAFQKREFDTVIQLLEPIKSTNANFWPLSEMYAHACFLSGNTARAATRFQLISTSGQLPYSERADWYLLLCQLADYPKQKSEFDLLLSKILADEGHPYFKPARKLAAQMRQK